MERLKPGGLSNPRDIAPNGEGGGGSAWPTESAIAPTDELLEGNDSSSADMTKPRENKVDPRIRSGKRV